MHGETVKNIWMFRLILFTNFNAQFLYSLTICMLHYNPRHVSSINMPIFRRTNCIITASGIVTLCKRLYSVPDESRLLCSLLSFLVTPSTWSLDRAVTWNSWNQEAKVESNSKFDVPHFVLTKLFHARKATHWNRVVTKCKTHCWGN